MDLTPKYTAAKGGGLEKSINLIFKNNNEK